MRTLFLVTAFLVIGMTASDASRTTEPKQCLRPSPLIKVAKVCCCETYLGDYCCNDMAVCSGSIIGCNCK